MNFDDKIIDRPKGPISLQFDSFLLDGHTRDVLLLATYLTVEVRNDEKYKLTECN